MQIEKNSSCKKKGEGFVIGLDVVLRIYVALEIVQPYRDLKAGDKKNRSGETGNRTLDLLLRKPKA